MFRSDWQHDDPSSSGSDEDDAFTQSYIAASAARPTAPAASERSSTENPADRVATGALSPTRANSTHLNTGREEDGVIEMHMQDPTYLPSHASHTLPYRIVGVRILLFGRSAPTDPRGWVEGEVDDEGAERAEVKRIEGKGIDEEGNTRRIEALLSPVHAALERLRNTTVPPPNLRVNSKSAAQVVKERLVPVGRHIVELLRTVGEGERGGLELEICDHIARTYWPEEFVEVNGLRVLEMYRNALFGEGVDWQLATVGEDA